MENIIFKAIVGSYAYGTFLEGQSDIDIKGVFMQDPLDVLNRGYQEQECVNKDETYYEFRRFIDLCCSGNPTMLELLFTPEDCIIECHPIFRKLMGDRDKFLSKSCKWSFGGYAYSQIGKAKGLDKKMNWEKEKTERKGVLDFCYFYTKEFTTIPIKQWLNDNKYDQKFCGLTSLPHYRGGYNLYYDHIKDTYKDNPRDQNREDFQFKGIVSDIETSNEVSLSEVPEWYRKMCEGLLYWNKDEYQVHCKEYLQYETWLKERNTQRYVDIENHGQQIDGKNLLHCYRLLETGIEIAKDHTINVRRPNADYLIEIRKGKHDLQKLLNEANNKMEELNKEFDISTLRDKVDRGYFMALLPKLRNEYQQLKSKENEKV